MNIERAESGWPPVVVAGGYQTGVVLMRDLKRRGVSCSCVDFNPVQPCFKTVYGKGYLCPNPDEDPAGWVRFMIGLAGQTGGRPVLIPSADVFVSAIAAHAAELEPYFIFLRSFAAVQALLATKQRQYEIAAEHGMQVPRTRFAQSIEEVRRFSAEARFPCLMKPVHFREWERFPPGHPLRYQKIALADTPEQLEAQYRLASSATSEAVLQEVIEGPDDAKLVYLSCYGRGGDRLGACVLKEIRTSPVYFGSASVVVPIEDPETDRLCDRFLRGAGYAGICEIELKRDTRDGRVKMIEANPRYSVTADAGSYAGVDIGWLHYLDLIGKAVEPVRWHGRDFRHVVLSRDFSCFRSYRAAGLMTWRDFLRCYRRPVAFFDFDPRDWRVTVDTMKELTKIVLGPAVRKIIPRRKA